VTAHQVTWENLEELELRRDVVVPERNMDAEIAALEAKRTKVHQPKQGMMRELLTGRIRLV